MLNTAVGLSCAVLHMGCKLQGPWLGLLLCPLPLAGCKPRVRDTVYFLFVPWLAKYWFKNLEVLQANARSRVVLGAFLLEVPLKKFMEDHEGYSWMVSVAFGIAQKIAGANLAKW
jgi:hypothetical protein